MGGPSPTIDCSVLQSIPTCNLNFPMQRACAALHWCTGYLHVNLGLHIYIADYIHGNKHRIVVNSKGVVLEH